MGRSTRSLLPYRRTSARSPALEQCERDSKPLALFTANPNEGESDPASIRGTIADCTYTCALPRVYVYYDNSLSADGMQSSNLLRDTINATSSVESFVQKNPNMQRANKPARYDRCVRGKTVRRSKTPGRRQRFASLFTRNRGLTQGRSWIRRQIDRNIGICIDDRVRNNDDRVSSIDLFFLVFHCLAGD